MYNPVCLHFLTVMASLTSLSFHYTYLLDASMETWNLASHLQVTKDFQEHLGWERQRVALSFRDVKVTETMLVKALNMCDILAKGQMRWTSFILLVNNLSLIP